MSLDAYEVAIKLKLEDHFSAGMDKVTKGLADANKQADALLAKLDKLGKSGALPVAVGEDKRAAHKDAAKRAGALESARKLKTGAGAHAAAAKTPGASGHAHKKAAEVHAALEAPAKAGGKGTRGGAGKRASAREMAGNLKLAGNPAASLDKIIHKLNEATREVEKMHAKTDKLGKMLKKGADMMNKLKASGLFGNHLDRAIALLEKLRGWLGRAMEGMEYVTKGLHSLSSALKHVRQFVSAVTTVVKFLQSALGGLANGPLKLVTAAFRIVGVVFSAVGQAVLFLGRALMLNPIGLIVTAIAAAVYLLWKNWGTIGPKVMAIWEKIKTALGGFVDWLAEKWQQFKSWLPSFLLGGSDDKPAPAVNAPDTHPARTAPHAAAHRASHAASGRSPHIAPHAHGKTVHVHTQINIDGRKVAHSVTKHQARAASRANAAQSAYDGSMSPRAVGAA